jgi:hypothetical protein
MSNLQRQFQPLHDLFGFVPSFHDPRVLELSLIAPDTLTIKLYVYDLTEEGKWKQDWDRDLHVIVTISFLGITEFELKLSDRWLNRIDFKEQDGYVETSIEEIATDATSRLTSRSVLLDSYSLPPAPFCSESGQDMESFTIKMSPQST